jgi:aspartyl-tRNA(Asn)/glutamyl-tRNA(Gln) amidotransferase subunit C
MSGLTPEETAALARLARLSLEDHETERFAAQLARVLAYIDTLERAVVDTLEEYQDPRAQGVGLREDVAGATLAPEQILAGVPVSREGQVLVPKFKEG